MPLFGMEEVNYSSRQHWTKEKQPDPPNFGEARRISQPELVEILRRRRPACERFLAAQAHICPFIPGKVSLVILSCKRLPELKRLLSGLVPFFQKIEKYPLIEKILVDNGSGSDLIDYCKKLGFFDHIVAHPKNLGMAGALNDIYPQCNGEFILFVEDDFIIDYSEAFLERCVNLMRERPEVGIIRLKNQNNWWKPTRVISERLVTKTGVPFWLWLPYADYLLLKSRWLSPFVRFIKYDLLIRLLSKLLKIKFNYNVWVCGSVLFRKSSFMGTGRLAEGKTGRKQAVYVEAVYGRKYNSIWLAAKLEQCYPFVQPNDNALSPGFLDKL
ncbi:MAG TPA: glycosyltransferase [Elusimicrobiota bacterium]|nr:glycosyltransferase [Elusimicrobiota bacterium]